MFDGLLPTQPALARQLGAKPALSHAYILSGGTEKAREALAALLSQAMVCTEADTQRIPCLHCTACRKAAAAIHPDICVTSLPEGKRDITVEQIRMLRADTYIRPNEADRKVYIIRQADAMNQNAQNALLKVLEDGPPYAAFLLCTENAGLLLPTIRSRCESLSLAPNAREERPPSDTAARFVSALLDGDEFTLMEYCTTLEKMERDAFAVLLEDAVSLLGSTLRADPARRGRILAVIALLEQMRGACRFYVGSGHLSAWLCAKLFSSQ
ncbi:MAG: DNA polymerase III subunit delta [Oscillospiraceae bacterium]|nr:DNA polymerase III subunit delta [Oscillospiraceae bacterium]